MQVTPNLMANKRAKATIARGKKRAPVKQAYQRRQKSAIRFRNDQLREDLDRRAQALYVVCIMIRHGYRGILTFSIADTTASGAPIIRNYWATERSTE